jgi:hypothetical protein
VLLPAEWVAASSPAAAAARPAAQAARRAAVPSPYANAEGPLSRLRLFAGTSNPTLGAEVASYLGLDLGKIKVKRFADGETYVQVRNERTLFFFALRRFFRPAVVRSSAAPAFFAPPRWCRFGPRLRSLFSRFFPIRPPPPPPLTRALKQPRKPLHTPLKTPP